VSQFGSSNPNWRGGDIEKHCAHCGKLFSFPRWRKRRFCSRRCARIVDAMMTKHKRKCAVCGIRLPNRHNKLYCSTTCEGKAKTGKNNNFYRGVFTKEALAKIIKARHARPNNPEAILIKLIEQNNLPFKYVGNGEVVIKGKNPDFIHLREKKVIEVFGIYWHSPLYGRVRVTMTEKATRDHYRNNGYDCLILWDVELWNNHKILDKIIEFVGGEKICV
jgi:predicted nucleic acid-binding Zn ribbon protein